MTEIKILKLSNGDEIIGEFEHDVTDCCDFYNVLKPMSILGVKDDSGLSGALRLRSTLLLSDDEMLNIPSKHVMTYYNPSKFMRQYYIKAAEYAFTYTKDAIDQQIELAANEMDENIKEEENSKRNLTELLMKSSGSRLQ